MPAQAQFIPSTDAARRLGVRLQTLYAYVSRGHIRTKPDPGDPRSRLYSTADLDGMKKRRERQRRPATAAGTALDWGMPVLETRISAIEAGRLTFRGKDAATLSERATAEEVAGLLWRAPAAAFPAPRGGVTLGARATDRAIARLASLVADDAPGLNGEALAARARGLIGHIAEAAAGVRLAGGPIHTALAKACGRPAASEAIRRALVLSADHELNASSFAVRVVASTGAALGNALIAGLAALSGPRHGGATERVAAFLDEMARAPSAAAAVAARLGRGEPIPGFGHPLYRAGDPRAAVLLADKKTMAVVARLVDAVDAATGLRPNIDVALVAIERAYRLPGGAALALFATGRSLGWVAHAMEQWETGQLIRPRARYLGEAPTVLDAR